MGPVAAGPTPDRGGCDTRVHAHRVHRFRSDRRFGRAGGPSEPGDRVVDHGRLVAIRRRAGAREDRSRDRRGRHGARSGPRRRRPGHARGTRHGLPPADRQARRIVASSPPTRCDRDGRGEHQGDDHRASRCRRPVVRRRPPDGRSRDLRLRRCGRGPVRRSALDRGARRAGRPERRAARGRPGPCLPGQRGRDGRCRWPTTGRWPGSATCP